MSVKGGAGDDAVSVSMTQPATAEIKADESGADFGQDSLDGALKAFVDGALAAGPGGSNAGLLQPLVGAVIDYATDALSATPGIKPKAAIDGGEGDDTIAVDTTLAFASFRGVDVKITDAAGYDRLHLTGKLRDENSITGGASGIGLIAEQPPETAAVFCAALKCLHIRRVSRQDSPMRKVDSRAPRVYNEGKKWAHARPYSIPFKRSRHFRPYARRKNFIDPDFPTGAANDEPRSNV